ncbi:MAG: cell division protein FtsZ [Verrucomicrobiota bacterium]
MNPQELPLEPVRLAERNLVIKLVGVGGAGTNAVNRLQSAHPERLQLAVVNTDQRALEHSPVAAQVLIGQGVTRGLGAGGDPELGREAAEADREQLAAVVQGCDLVFLIAGLGGGTGSGALPVVAELAAEHGALVIAFVSLPFSFEGGRRLKQAEEGLLALRRVCDAVIPLPNDLLLQEGADDRSARDSFARADAWIGRGVQSIAAMMFQTGLINLDFAALRQVFQHPGGKTLFGLGEGAGANAVDDAIASLKLCPLLHTPEFARKADRMLVNIVGGPDLTLPKVNGLMTAITEQFGRESNIIMGAVIDETWADRVEVCVLGLCDPGTRATTARRPTPGSRTRSPFAAPEGAAPPPPTPPPPTVRAGRSGPGGAPAPVPPVEDTQHEFGFGEVESRGHFEKTDRNLFDGYDLDVPAYLRKGVKISL